MNDSIYGWLRSASASRVTAICVRSPRGVFRGVSFPSNGVRLTHETKRLENASYRAGCGAPSKDLSGAVAQVQGAVAVAMQSRYGMFWLNGADGTVTGEQVFNVRPRAFIVIGSLGEFVSEHFVNNEEFRSLEVYRNSLAGTDTLTFDGLHERSKFIVDAAPKRERLRT